MFYWYQYVFLHFANKVGRYTDIVSTLRLSYPEMTLLSDLDASFSGYLAVGHAAAFVIGRRKSHFTRNAVEVLGFFFFLGTIFDVGQWPHRHLSRLRDCSPVTRGWQEGGSAIID